MPPNSCIMNLGLGYFIAVSLAFLFLLSALLLVSYICLRSFSASSASPVATTTVIIPRAVFSNDGDGEFGIVGLDQSVINSYPSFEFSENSFDSSNCGGNGGSCSICLCDFKDSESIRMMPDCRHYFHLCCLDAWLKLSGSCPICRNSPIPTPTSTPIAEVVPIYQHAADRNRTQM